MNVRRAITLVLAALVAAPWVIAAQPARGSARPQIESDVWVPAGSETAMPPVVDDVEAAFARIQPRAEHVTACTNGLIPRPLYRTSLPNFFGLRNHFQGIQRLDAPGYVAISGSNKQGADLFIVRLTDTANPSDCEGDGRVVARVALDPVMWHAGGLSLLGPILAVPLHGGAPRRGQVAFYDLSDPESPRRLAVEIDRLGRKASATAVTRLSNGHVLVAVLAAYDGLPRRVDFYLSRTTDLNDGFAPDPLLWRVSDVGARPGQDRTFAHFQGVNFLRQADGRLYLVGLHNQTLGPTALPGRDYADLYEVVFPPATTEDAQPVLSMPRIIKVANRMVRCTDGFCNLNAAAGVFVDPDTRALSIYATPGWVGEDAVKVSIYRSSGAGSRPNPRPGPTATRR